MKKINWEAFFDNDKIAVSCRTEEEANDFIKKACQNVIFKQKWCYYGNTDKDTNWVCLESETCYYNTACFGYHVINWSDFILNPKNPYDTKEKYFKSGYIVRTQNNRTSLILLHENVIYLLDADNSSYVKFNVEDYDNNLINSANPDYTIPEIYSQIKGSESVEMAIPV